MTSPGSGGDRSPVPWAAVVDDLLDVHGRAAMLQTMFDGSSSMPPSAVGRELTEGMLSRVTSALSAVTAGGDGGESSYPGGRGSGRRRSHRRSSSSSSSSSRRRTLSPFVETVTTNKLEDGHAWRKYGQKRIQDSENPRSYYRCTHMLDQGCKARKQVQVSDTNPSEYIVSYFGLHTCRDPSTVPIVIEAATDAPTNLANFISFGSTSTTSAHAVPSHRQQAVRTPAMMLSRFAGYSSSLPSAAYHQERCGSEEAISSISPAGQLGAVVGSSSTRRTTSVGSAPEYDMLIGGIETGGSFPSSPSSLDGFMTASFGSFGDDDLFGFDP